MTLFEEISTSPQIVGGRRTERSSQNLPEDLFRSLMPSWAARVRAIPGSIQDVSSPLAMRQACQLMISFFGEKRSILIDSPQDKASRTRRWIIISQSLNSRQEGFRRAPEFKQIFCAIHLLCVSSHSHRHKDYVHLSYPHMTAYPLIELRHCLRSDLNRCRQVLQFPLRLLRVFQ